MLKPDEATQLDEIIESLEDEISSSEIFSALFEPELAGKIGCWQGKNCVRRLLAAELLSRRNEADSGLDIESPAHFRKRNF